MTYQMVEMVRCEDVIRTEFALSSALALTPGNTQHNRAFLVGMNKTDSYNFFIHYMKLGIENGMEMDALLFCDLDVMLYSKDGLYPLVTAFWEHPEIDILTPTWGEPHPDIVQIPGGNTGYLLMRISALKKLTGPLYPIPAEIEVEKVFTDNDADFHVLCRDAGLRWLEHGGVSCNYFHEAFKSAGAEVPT